MAWIGSGGCERSTFAWWAVTKPGVKRCWQWCSVINYSFYHNQPSPSHPGYHLTYCRVLLFHISKFSICSFTLQLFCFLSLLGGKFNTELWFKINGFSEFELRRCRNSNRLSLVRKKTSPAPACTRKCCEYCPDEGDIHKRCAHPTEDDGWDDDWDEDKICDKYTWKWINGYHLWGYT